MKPLVAAFISSVAVAVAGCGVSGRTGATHDDLVRRTQEIMDSVAPGNPEPWTKYFHDHEMSFDEKGRFMDKAALLKEVSSLPNGYSGASKVVNAKSNIVRDTAVLSYD